MKRKIYISLAVAVLGTTAAIYFGTKQQAHSDSKGLLTQSEPSLVDSKMPSKSETTVQDAAPAKSRLKSPPPHCGCSNCIDNEKSSVIASIPLPNEKQESISLDNTLREYLFSRSKNQPIDFPLPQGKAAKGTVALSGAENGKTVFIQGELTAPAAGTFYFRDQSDHPGVAGSIVGVVRFAEGDLAYRVEPLGVNGAPILVEHNADDVFCRKYGQVLPDAEEIISDHPTNIDTSASQNDVPPLESLPGSSAVVYLDFDGEEGPHESWGDFDAAPWGGDRQQRINIWKRVAEDFAPFNINVTTDLQVYLAAPETSRQRCIITPTTNAQPGAGGVAFFNSFNWAGDVPCWSFNGGENNAAMTVSHEIGHTLGLSHDGRTLPPDSTHEEYYSGHGSGTVGWGPIMGAPFGKSLTQWSEGEYANANQLENDIADIVINNNATDIRSDDHRDTLAAATALDILADDSVRNKGVIERETDFDSFKFTLTASGTVNITASPEAIGPNLDILLEIVDASNSVITSNNPDLSLDATINTTLSAGEYMIRVSGTGRGDILGDGYGSYGSLGSYQITGSITNALKQQRFSIAENTANGASVGTVLPNNNHGAAAINYSIFSGNTNSVFAIDSSTGELTVTNSSVLNYESLSTYFDDPAELRLTIFISNPDNSSLNEFVRIVVDVTDVNEPHTISGPVQAQVYRQAAANTIVAAFEVQSVDHYPAPTSWSITSGNTNNAFGINSSGRLYVANSSAIGNLNSFTLQITGTDNGPPSPVISASHTITLDILDWQPVDGLIPLTGRNWTQEAGVVATQSTTSALYGQGVNDATIAIDGNTSGNWTIGQTTHTDDQSNSWWQVDFGAEREIESIQIFNRTDCCQLRLSNFRVSVLDSGNSEVIGQDFYTSSGSVNNNETWTLPSVVSGRIVRIEIKGLNNDGNGVLSLAEVAVNSPAPKNLAGTTNWAREAGTSASQSSTYQSNDASRAIDGNINGNFNLGNITHTEDQANSWWEVDLAQERPISRVVLFNRTDCCGDRLSNYRITILDDSRSEVTGQDFHTGISSTGISENWTLPSTVTGRYVRVAINGFNSGSSGNGVLSLAEVEVYGSDGSSSLPVAQQSTTLNGLGASIAIDGVTAGDYSASQVTHTDSTSANWWEVNLGQVAKLEQIVLYNRTDCCQDRLSNFRVSIWNGSTEVYGSNHFTDGTSHADGQFTVASIGDMMADRVRIESLGTNSGGNRVISLAEVQVFGQFISSVNQAPVLADTSFNIAEDATSGSAVGTVTATDPNSGDMISYTITGGNTGGAFSINSSGDITTAAALDYETLASYVLQVTATDDGTPQLSDTATVTVNVSNITLGDDSDGDGLNDDFESTHFPTISSETSSTDPDGDGYDNAHELAFAGDPNQNDSQKHSVIYKRNPSNSNLMLSYRRPQDYATYGLSYKLMSTTDLGTPWTEVSGIIPTIQANADTSETVTYDIPPSGTIRFYKVEAN